MGSVASAGLLLLSCGGSVAPVARDPWTMPITGRPTQVAPHATGRTAVAAPASPERSVRLEGWPREEGAPADGEPSLADGAPGDAAAGDALSDAELEREPESASLGDEGYGLDSGEGGVLAQMLSPSEAAPAGLWWADDRAAASEARRLGRPLVMDLWASWCLPCRLMVATTLRDPSVSAELASYFVAVKLDVTEDSPANKKLLGAYRVYKLPALLVLDGKGREMARLESYTDPSTFLGWLQAHRAAVAPAPARR